MGNIFRDYVFEDLHDKNAKNSFLTKNGVTTVLRKPAICRRQILNFVKVD